MRVRTALSAAALATTAALTMTACGGGSGGGNDKIPTTPSTSTTTAAAPTTAPPSGAALKIDPALKLPADLTVTFDWTLPSDHNQAVALVASADFIQAMTHAVVKQNTSDPVLAAYSAGDALSFGKSYVQQYVSHGWTLTGTDRYYSPKVQLSSAKSSAQVTFCEDQSKVFGKVISTGKILTTTPSDSSYVSYTITVSKLPVRTELWQAQSITVKEKALQCKQ